MSVSPQLEKIEERAKKVAETMERAAKKLASGMEKFAEELEKRDIPKIVRNVMIIVTAMMTMWTMYYALSLMAPTAAAVFMQFGLVLGYIVPLAFMVMILSLVAGIVRILIR